MATVITVDEAKRRTEPGQVKSPLYLELMALPFGKAMEWLIGEVPSDLLQTSRAVAEDRKVKLHFESIVDGDQGLVVWFEER